MALDKYHYIMPMCIHIAPEAEQDPLPWRQNIPPSWGSKKKKIPHDVENKLTYVEYIRSLLDFILALALLMGWKYHS